MPPCKASPKPTPIQIAIRESGVLSSFLRGLTRLSASINEGSNTDWHEFESVRKDIESKFQFLEYEGEVSPDTPAEEALGSLSVHFTGQKERVAKALAHGDKCVGRAKLLLAFRE